VPTTAVCPFEAEFATVIAAAGPAAKLTVALLDNVDPAIDALITAAPAAVAEVSVAVYVPLFASLTGPTVPRDVLTETMPPLFPSDAPVSSLSATVICVVDLPSATIDEDAAVTVDNWTDATGPVPGPEAESQLSEKASSVASTATDCRENLFSIRRNIDAGWVRRAQGNAIVLAGYRRGKKKFLLLW
jgi:hypothetical protein